jgi:hypothetical protein
LDCLSLAWERHLVQTLASVSGLHSDWKLERASMVSMASMASLASMAPMAPLTW